MAVRFSDALPRGDLLAFEPSTRWVRAWSATDLVVDTQRALLVWGTGKVVPAYAAPRDDVAVELLRAHGGDESGDPDIERFWDLDSGDARLERAAWTYRDPDLADHFGLRFSSLQRWTEEDEEIVGHPRDPFKRVDARRSSRHVVVEIEGVAVAESTSPTIVFETGLPDRYYLPREDVRMDLLRASDTRTTCAYKGLASYFSLAAGEVAADDVAWTYPEPLPEQTALRGLVAFFNERAEITVDGTGLERPVTQWS